MPSFESPAERAGAGPDQPEPTAGIPLRRRRWPGWWTCTIVAACAALAVLLQAGILRGGMEQAAVNVATAALLVASAVTLLVWFLFFSAVPLRWRLLLAAALALAGLSVEQLVRIEQVTGDLVPRLVPRWRPESDRLLVSPADALPAERLEADLATTTGSDFPQFLGPQRDAHLEGVGLARDWHAQPPQELWRIRIGAGWSGFAVVNGYAVTMEQRGEEEIVSCYAVDRGELIWWHAISARHQTLLGGVGPRSTPTIDRGKVYALGASGVLRCLDGSRGSLLWQQDLLALIGVTPAEDLAAIAWGRAASPLIVDQRVVVPLGGKKDGPWKSLAAFDADTGASVWTGGERQASYSSPGLATLGGERQIVIVNQDFASGHDPRDGRCLWEYPWPGSSSADANTSQAAVIGGDRLLLSKGYGGGATLLGIDRGDGEWTARPIWQEPSVLRTKLTNVVVCGEHVFGLSDGILQCVDIRNGNRLWRGGRYGHGQLLGADDLLLVQAETGEIALVEASPEQHRELGQIPALVGKTWNNPALFGKLLLVRNADQAACYRLP